MSIKVINPSLPKKPILFKDMEIGRLYKLSDADVETVYIRTLQNTCVWIEDERIGTLINVPNDYRFIKAPEGTEIHFVVDK